MIKAQIVGSGVKVTIEHNGNSGNAADILEELTAILRAFRDTFGEDEHDFAERAIVYAGHMAFDESDEDRMKATEEFIDWMQKNPSDGDVKWKKGS